MGRLFADTAPLRTPDFRRLWVSGIPTVIGANLTIFAVPVQLYALTQNSAYVGLSGIFALVPLVVFGLWGGALADAMDRRVLLIIASIGLAVSSVFLWLQAALELNSVWTVLCLLSVQQAFYAINSPTRSAAIPRMLPEDQVAAANSLIGACICSTSLNGACRFRRRNESVPSAASTRSTTIKRRPTPCRCSTTSGRSRSSGNSGYGQRTALKAAVRASRFMETTGRWSSIAAAGKSTITVKWSPPMPRI